MWQTSEMTSETAVNAADAEEFLMTDPMALAELERYWAGLAPAGQVPRRSDIDPAALRGLIEDCMMLERVAPGVARVRVAGQRINDLSGYDLRGMPLSVMFTPQARATLTRAVERAFHGPAIVEVPLRSHGGLTQPALDGRLILLPLKDGFGRVTRCLAALVASGRRGKGGRRFEIDTREDMRTDPINHLSVASNERRPAPLKNKTEERPALRLVVNNA